PRDRHDAVVLRRPGLPDRDRRYDCLRRHGSRVRDLRPRARGTVPRGLPIRDASSLELRKRFSTIGPRLAVVFRGEPLKSPEPLIRRVYAYVAYRVGDGPDAEDITSDVFERALRKQHQFDPKRGDVAAWLVGIARRCIADHFDDKPIPVDSVPEHEAPGELASDAAGRVDMGRV